MNRACFASGEYIVDASGPGWAGPGRTRPRNRRDCFPETRWSLRTHLPFPKRYLVTRPETFDVPSPSDPFGVPGTVISRRVRLRSAARTSSLIGATIKGHQLLCVCAQGTPFRDQTAAGSPSGSVLILVFLPSFLVLFLITTSQARLDTPSRWSTRTRIDETTPTHSDSLGTTSEERWVCSLLCLGLGHETPSGSWSAGAAVQRRGALFGRPCASMVGAKDRE
jgi:hypothetical protein